MKGGITVSAMFPDPVGTKPWGRGRGSERDGMLKNDRKVGQLRPSRLANEVDPGNECTNLRPNRVAGESGDITDKGKRTAEGEGGRREREREGSGRKNKK